MIIGIGTDIIAINRIKTSFDKYGDKFLNRCFTEHEIKRAHDILDKNKKIAYFAKRWAGKEAFAKAAGCGIGGNISFKDIDISKYSANNAPILNISKNIHIYLSKLCNNQQFKIDISLSDEKDFALAFVIISLL